MQVKKLYDSSRLDFDEIPTCFRDCFLPGRAKDLSAPRYTTLPRYSGVQLLTAAKFYNATFTFQVLSLYHGHNMKFLVTVIMLLVWTRNGKWQKLHILRANSGTKMTGFRITWKTFLMSWLIKNVISQKYSTLKNLMVLPHKQVIAVKKVWRGLRCFSRVLVHK